MQIFINNPTLYKREFRGDFKNNQQNEFKSRRLSNHKFKEFCSSFIHIFKMKLGHEFYFILDNLPSSCKPLKRELSTQILRNKSFIQLLSSPVKIIMKLSDQLIQSANSAAHANNVVKSRHKHALIGLDDT